MQLVIALPRRERLAARALLASVLAVIAFLVAAGIPFPSAPNSVRHADFMVVLGGNNAVRGELAAQLWRSGMAPTVIASGAPPDCTEISDVLVAHGVNAKSILPECNSLDTFENAQFSVRMLPPSATRVLIVTDLFHSGRALFTFRTLCPGVEFSTFSVPGDGDTPIEHVVGEYVKAVYYRARLAFVALFRPRPAPPCAG